MIRCAVLHLWSSDQLTPSFVLLRAAEKPSEVAVDAMSSPKRPNLSQLANIWAWNGEGMRYGDGGRQYRCMSDLAPGWGSWLDKASTARGRISAKLAGRPLMAHQRRGRGPRLPPEELVGAPVSAQLATVPPCLSAPSAQLVQLVYLEYDHRLQICEDMQPSLEHRAISSPRGSGNRFSLRTRTLVSSHPESAPDGCKTLRI